MEIKRYHRLPGFLRRWKRFMYCLPPFCLMKKVPSADFHRCLGRTVSFIRGTTQVDIARAIPTFLTYNMICRRKITGAGPVDYY